MSIAKPISNNVDFLQDIDTDIIIDKFASILERYSTDLEISHVFRHDAPDATDDMAVVSWDGARNFQLITLGGNKYRADHKISIGVIINKYDSADANQQIAAVAIKVAKILLNHPSIRFTTADEKAESIGSSEPLSIESAEPGTFTFGENVYRGAQVVAIVPVRFRFRTDCSKC